MRKKMSPGLDEKLCEAFPKIFKDRHGDMRETAMCWGFDFSDGWYGIINKLCTAIQKHLDENHHVPQVVATQAKEKFGTLRFYITGGDDYISDLIEHAVEESGRTCEMCGKPGETVGARRVRTVCAEHRQGTVGLRRRSP
jgi:hypothetical protein